MGEVCMACNGQLNSEVPWRDPQGRGYHADCVSLIPAADGVACFCGGRIRLYTWPGAVVLQCDGCLKVFNAKVHAHDGVSEPALCRACGAPLAVSVLQGVGGRCSILKCSNPEHGYILTSRFEKCKCLEEDEVKMDWKCAECGKEASMFLNGTTYCRECKDQLDEERRRERLEWEALSRLHPPERSRLEPSPKLPVEEMRTALQMVIESLKKQGIAVPVQLQSISMSSEEDEDGR